MERYQPGLEELVEEQVREERLLILFAPERLLAEGEQEARRRRDRVG